MASIKFTFLTRFILIGASLLLPAAYVRGAPPAFRDELVQVLRHQESLIRTLELEYEIVASTTDTQSIEDIKRICKREGREKEWPRFVYTDEVAKHNSSRAHWWAKGVKERLEEINFGQDKEVRAYDGNIVRILGTTADDVIGSLFTREGAHWTTANTVQPNAFLFQFQRTPYSEIISHSPNFEAALVREGGERRLKASFQHSTIPFVHFELLFAPDYKLMSRKLVIRMGKEPFRVWEKHAFSSYESLKDESGETIWFPRSCYYQYFMGNREDGTPVEYYHQTITVNKIELNKELSDDLFTIKFPKNAKIYDGITGAGLIDAKNDPPAVIRESAGYAWLVLTGIGCVLAVLALVAIGKRKKLFGAPSRET